MKKLIYTLFPFEILISVVLRSGKSMYSISLRWDGESTSEWYGRCIRRNFGTDVSVLSPLLFTTFRLPRWRLLSLQLTIPQADSAAGTALATGKKTYNHAISVGKIRMRFKL